MGHRSDWTFGGTGSGVVKHLTASQTSATPILPPSSIIVVFVVVVINFSSSFLGGGYFDSECRPLVDAPLNFYSNAKEVCPVMFTPSKTYGCILEEHKGASRCFYHSVSSSLPGQMKHMNPLRELSVLQGFSFWPDLPRRLHQRKASSRQKPESLTRSAAAHLKNCFSSHPSKVLIREVFFILRYIFFPCFFGGFFFPFCAKLL